MLQQHDIEWLIHQPLPSFATHTELTSSCNRTLCVDLERRSEVPCADQEVMAGGDQLVSDVQGQSELLLYQLYNVVNVN